jgi:dUTP pyrophosphatase
MVQRGDRVAQAVIASAAHVEIVLVEALSATDRGDGGFGSTG